MHHVVAAAEEGRRLGEPADVVVEAVEDRRHLLEDEVLALAKRASDALIHGVETKALDDSALLDHAGGLLRGGLRSACVVEEACPGLWTVAREGGTEVGVAFSHAPRI
jgi:hypothetical protein